MRILSLVCEGACGAPHTTNYDNALKDRGLNGPSRLDLAARLSRRLIHTEHLAVDRRGWMGREMFECLECGHPREFGWPETGVPWELDSETVQS